MLSASVASARQRNNVGLIMRRVDGKVTVIHPVSVFVDNLAIWLLV